MAWILQDDAESEIIKDILNPTYHDRVIGIVGAAFVDDRLTEKIQGRFNYDTDITPRLFRGSGPLGSFGTKIDVGFLLGLYGEEIHENLDLVRRIRNEFAHVAKGTTFKTGPIHALCRSFTIMSRFTHPDAPDSFAGGMPTVHEAMMSPPIGAPVPKEPRDIYVTVLQILLGYLHFIPAAAPPKPDF